MDYSYLQIIIRKAASVQRPKVGSIFHLPGDANSDSLEFLYGDVMEYCNSLQQLERDLQYQAPLSRRPGLDPLI